MICGPPFKKKITGCQYKIAITSNEVFEFRMRFKKTFISTVWSTALTFIITLIELYVLKRPTDRAKYEWTYCNFCTSNLSFLSLMFPLYTYIFTNCFAALWQIWATQRALIIFWLSLVHNFVYTLFLAVEVHFTSHLYQNLHWHYK